jgi:hypothetical protein
MYQYKNTCLAAAALLGLSFMVSAQEPEPRISPPARATVTLNGKEISIAYSRPSMRARKIMGGLVPYGEVWRTGANEATTFKTAANLLMGGVTVPAGTYTLYSLPTESGWKLIVNKQTGQWGTDYDPRQDLARIDLVSSMLKAPVETFTIAFDKKSASGAELVLTWELTKLTLPVRVQ